MVPLTKGLTTALSVEPPTIAVTPPGDDVTVKRVIGRPPVEAGGVQLTVALVLPAVATTFVGGPGAVGGRTVTPLEGVDGALVPIPFVAVTVNVYVVFGTRPVTTTPVADGPALAAGAAGEGVTV
jgi:hypothetical protein